MFPLLFTIAFLIIYLWAARRQVKSGFGWPWHRSCSFALGMLLLGLSVSPWMHKIAMTDLRGHMVQHLLLAMLAPVALVFGAPLTLLLKTLPKAWSRRLAHILHSGPMQTLTHPITALLLNIGGMFLLYLTPLYLLSQQQAAVHVLVHIHFLFAGYLFAWSIAGPDPAPKRPGFVMRLSVIFLAMASHGALSKWMYAQGLPAGTFHSLEEIRAAAKIMYYGGDFAELILVIALFWLWFQKQEGQAAYAAARP